MTELYERKEYVKDPDEVLDYTFDWACVTNGTSTDGEVDWLQSGETISSHTITEETGLTVDSSSLTDTNTSVTVWLSGGTAGNDYDVECDVVTSGSRTGSRTIIVKVRNR